MAQRVSISTAALIAILVGAGGFALGQATSSSSSNTTSSKISTEPNDPRGSDLPSDHPGAGDMSGAGNDMGSGADLPPNHPALDTTGIAPSSAGEATLKWTAPGRWKSVPSPNNMRLATYAVPRATGDAEDAELAVTQVGGGVDANIDRWKGQFDADSQSSLKRSSKVVHGMQVTLVQIEGTYSGGMGPAQGPKKNYALCGAIVETDTMPYFFKMTGPTKTVHAACSELDTMLDTVTPK